MYIRIGWFILIKLQYTKYSNADNGFYKKFEAKVFQKYYSPIFFPFIKIRKDNFLLNLSH